MMHLPVSILSSLVTLGMTGGCFIMGLDRTVAEDDVDFDPVAIPLGDHNELDTLAACTQGLSRDEIEDTAAIAYEFRDSAHEMIVCGGLAMSVAVTLVEGFIDLAVDPERSTLPNDLQVHDDGRYRVDVEGTRRVQMDVQFFYGEDYEVGQRGEPVIPNLFVMSSYLTDATAEFDALTGELQIRYRSPGPLVELLGMGAQPPNPLVIDAYDPGELHMLGAKLRKLQMQANIRLEDHPATSTIGYEVDAPMMLVDHVLRGTPLTLEMIEADGRRLDLSQRLEVTTWDIRYVDSAVGRLDGEITMDVAGHRFPFSARLGYRNSSEPTFELFCAN